MHKLPNKDIISHKTHCQFCRQVLTKRTEKKLGYHKDCEKEIINYEPDYSPMVDWLNEHIYHEKDKEFTRDDLWSIKEISFNGINDEPIPDAFSDLPNLESLAFINFERLDIPESVLSLQKLTHIGITEYHQPEIPAIIFDLPFQSLFVMAEQLELFPEKILNRKDLTYLYIGFSKINAIPNLMSLAKLQVLSLEYNALTEFPKIASLQHLKRLDLSDNYIKKIPEKKGSIPRSIQSLALANNQIEEIPDWIVELPNLTELYLDENPLSANSKKLLEEFTKRKDKKV